jgi:hypothetical protein
MLRGRVHISADRRAVGADVLTATIVPFDGTASIQSFNLYSNIVRW